jgi:hypothetical protein
MKSKKTIVLWAVVGASVFVIFVLAALFFIGWNSLNQRYTEDHRDALYTSVTGQVVLKYDASKLGRR